VGARVGVDQKNKVPPGNREYQIRDLLNQARARGARTSSISKIETHAAANSGKPLVLTDEPLWTSTCDLLTRGLLLWLIEL